jgi:colanic acid biosynthesis glycosyl transferase WcaI
LKLLLHGLNYWPELIGVGKYSGEMAAWLAARGVAVRVVTAPPYYPQWRIAAGYRAGAYQRERVDGVEVVRCPLWVPERKGAPARALHLLSFAASSAPVVLREALLWRPDVVMGVEPTLLAAPATVAAARLCGAAAWLHVQDFEFEAAFATGLLGGARRGRWAASAEARLLRRFDRVSTISPAMAEHLARKGVAPERITLLPNWVATDAIHPLPGASPLRRALGIAETEIVALYAGNMSEKQGLDMLVAAAAALQDRPQIRFVFAGEGAARGRLEQAAAGLGNVRFLPLQPAERLNDLLNLADLHLLPQRAGVADLVMPSKLLGMMASARPVIAGADASSALGRVVSGCGLIVPPEDGAAMAAALRTLAADPARRGALGQAGRARIIAEWGRDAVLGRLALALEEIGRTRRAARTIPPPPVGRTAD